MNLKEFYNYFARERLYFVGVLVNDEFFKLDWDPTIRRFKTITGLKFSPIIVVRKDKFKRGHVNSSDGTEYELRIVSPFRRS